MVARITLGLRLTWARISHTFLFGPEHCFAQWEWVPGDCFWKQSLKWARKNKIKCKKFSSKLPGDFIFLPTWDLMLTIEGAENELSFISISAPAHTIASSPHFQRKRKVSLIVKEDWFKKTGSAMVEFEMIHFFLIIGCQPTPYLCDQFGNCWTR